MSAGGPIIMATEAKASGGGPGWGFWGTIVGFGLNALWSIGNVMRSEARRSKQEAEQSKEAAISARLEVFAAQNATQLAGIQSSIESVRTSVAGHGARFDAFARDIRELREADRKLEVEVSKNYAALATKVDLLLGDRSREGKRA